MRLQHFCIGSSVTQDLLVSKSFLPLGAANKDSDIQTVWATFLDLFQNEQRWASLRSRPNPDWDLDRRLQPSIVSPVSAAALANPRRESLTGATMTGGSRSAPSPSPPAPGAHSVRRPLQWQEGCFVYHTINDLILVACCPLPPAPPVASSSVTRIPSSLQEHSVSKSNSDLGSSEVLQRRPELAFSTGLGLHVSPHGIIDFLSQLCKALERYLSSSKDSNGGRPSSGPGQASNPSVTTATTTFPSKHVGSGPTLSAETIRRNIGLVYEVLDECMELGYPMMPSLAQLDLLVFGTSKSPGH
ncbi:hypothetical protein BGZ98_006118 [Dissophora globulifera]|nr:hypothetical protein BGZ98_006118 [Dissophora globulifera]